MKGSKSWSCSDSIDKESRCSGTASHCWQVTQRLTRARMTLFILFVHTCNFTFPGPVPPLQKDEEVSASRFDAVAWWKIVGALYRQHRVSETTPYVQYESAACGAAHEEAQVHVHNATSKVLP